MFSHLRFIKVCELMTAIWKMAFLRVVRFQLHNDGFDVSNVICHNIKRAAMSELLDLKCPH